MDKPITTVALILAGMLGLFAVSGLVQGDDHGFGEREHEEHEEHEGRFGLFRHERTPGVMPVTNELYQAECGSCHMAYQPGLLPVRSWERLMGSLDDHFDDVATLPEKTRVQLLSYLVDNAADRSDARRSRKILRTIPADQAPLRVSETRYFRAKHRELPRRMVQGNPEVGSFSNCAACHRTAERGIYSEHEIVIPGYGRVD